MVMFVVVGGGNSCSSSSRNITVILLLLSITIMGMSSSAGGVDCRYLQDKVSWPGHRNRKSPCRSPVSKARTPKGPST